MVEEDVCRQAEHYLHSLCNEISERCVGSEGNRRATDFFHNEIGRFGWEIRSQGFEAYDWHDGGAELSAQDRSFDVLVSPYSVGCDVKAPLVSAATVQELEGQDIAGKILLLHGEIAREQIMPKNFIFYNPEEHQKIVSHLEDRNPKALVTATGRDGGLAGGVYPFPMFEDGDFDIPSVYMTAEEGRKLLSAVGSPVVLRSNSRRIPGSGRNVVARKGRDAKRRVVVTAHIDAKKGSPGAIDNATGIVVLLLTAHLLESYAGVPVIEIVALNGEDYYSVPGQMRYIEENEGNFDTIKLNINIDGAGFHRGPSAFSLYDLPQELCRSAEEAFESLPSIIKGELWPQGDHSIFLQYGVPAIALSSDWFIKHIETQDITHTAKDNPAIVEPARLVEIAHGLAAFLLRYAAENP